MPSQLVTIEGNIGSGKTTVAKTISSYMPDTKFFPAPGRSKNPYWDRFHQDPKANALAMQCWFLRERLKVYLAALRHIEHTKESAVLDFSLWSDEAFATSHYECGYMTTDEFATYQGLSRAIFALKLPPPHLTIVLHAKPEVCLQRAVGLERPKLSEAYLRRLDELHRERYLRDLDTVFTPRWLQSQRVPLDAPGLAPAPSLQTLVRDWSDLSAVKPVAIGDAVMCTEPTDLDAWFAPFRAKGNAERVAAVLDSKS